MQTFDFQLRTRMVCGENAIDQLGELTVAAGYHKVMIVSDPGIVDAGHVDRGVAALKKSGIEPVVFDGAKENPTTQEIDAGLAFAKDFQPDLLIGLGGGSSMDCAKGINFVYSCGGVMEDYWGVGKATGPMLPMFAIPTTSGTGSEMQSFALISQADTHIKMACGDKRATCQIAILDPVLTLTQPPMVTALTGIDAISHAIETSVTSKRSEVSAIFASQAWSMLSEHFPTVLMNPDDLQARAAMQRGAAWSGVAIENSMLGAAHALANPLTAKYGIAHGQAVGLMLPHVVEFNSEHDANCEAIYGDLLRASNDLERDGLTNGQKLAKLLTGLCGHAGLETSLEELRIDPADIPELALAASKQWVGTFNPVPITEASLQSIYHKAFAAEPKVHS